MDAHYDSIKKNLRYPDKLRQQLADIPAAYRIALMFYSRMQFTTYLHTENLLSDVADFYSPKDSMRVLLECIPQNMLIFTDMAMKLAPYPEKLDIYLSMLNERSRRLLFNVCDNNRDTVLHVAAHHPESFKKIFALADNREARTGLILAANNEGETVFHLATAYDELFDLAAAQIPEQDRHAAAEMETKDERKLINFARNKNTMLKVLSVYPPAERLELLTRKPKYGRPAIQAACESYDWLISTVSFVHPRDWSKAMAATGLYGAELLRKLASEPEKMLELLGLYSADDVLPQIPAQSLLDWKPEDIIKLMNLLPSTPRELNDNELHFSSLNDKILFVGSMNVGLSSFLIEYAKRNFDNAVKVLDAMPVEDRIKTIELAGDNQFYNIAAEHNPAYAEKMKAAMNEFKQSHPQNHKAAPKKLSQPSMPAPAIGFFGPTSRFGEIPKETPATMTVTEYKRLQNLHDALQCEARRLGQITQTEYWDYVAGYKHVNTLSDLERLRSILKCHEDVMKQHGIEPVKVDPYTVMFRPW